MSYDEQINKIKAFIIKYKLHKYAGLLSSIFDMPEISQSIFCPICPKDNPDKECPLCDGDGEIISTLEDDGEDQRVQKELDIK